MFAAAESLSRELANECRSTRRVLERVPESQLDWRPHAKSMTLGQLAAHVARMPARFARALEQDGLEIAPATPAPAPLATTAALVAEFDAGVLAAQSFLSTVTPEAAHGLWRLTNAGRELFSLPRLEIFRTMLLNHTYHHRGQLTVYLRLLDVPVPAVYGRSADEDGFAPPSGAATS